MESRKEKGSVRDLLYVRGSSSYSPREPGELADWWRKNYAYKAIPGAVHVR